ncbi:hypothetical protein VP150E351_P0087 [Vibrio phage 150E35-1]|nr:hypothetical protein VP150E351_P0087 [Vibrio phage 150E35-1]
MKVQIIIDDSELSKLDSYELVDNKPSDKDRSELLRDYLCCYTDFSELNRDDQDAIISNAERAIDEGWSGINVEIESGRDCRDMRCYTYMGSSPSNEEFVDYTTAEFTKYLEETA